MAFEVGTRVRLARNTKVAPASVVTMFKSLVETTNIPIPTVPGFDEET
ncbi:hypothetical protein [Nocardia sp. NPDC050175]